MIFWRILFFFLPFYTQVSDTSNTLGFFFLVDADAATDSPEAVQDLKDEVKDEVQDDTVNVTKIPEQSIAELAHTAEQDVAEFISVQDSDSK